MSEYWWLLSAYPVAAASSAVVYAVLLSLLFATPRAFFGEHLTVGLAKGRSHLGGFDTLRGLAAAYVAIAHCLQWTYPVFAPTQFAAPMLAYGSKAVPIFAALSGFLIYLSARNIQTTADVRVFVFRRLLRIMPVYVFILLILLSIDRLDPLGMQVSRTALFVSELFMFHVLQFPAFVNPVTWSLYIEVVFYALIPLYIICIPPNRRLLSASISLALLLFVASQVSVRTFDLWPFFFFGILAAEIAVSAGRFVSRVGPIKLVVAGATLLAFDLQGPRFDVFYQTGLVPYDSAGASLGLGIAMFLLMAGLMHAPRAGALLDVLPLRMIGSISYSLFLIHPIYIVLNFPALKFSLINQQFEMWKTFEIMPGWYLPFVFFPGVVLWAAIAFVFVEKPFIAWGRNLRSRRPAIASMPRNISSTPAE